ncbi:hypothetical protein DWV55_07145 [Butyricicoccus sp. AF10-3]|nr:hypothetical protein DWV55_07145 [Butyricicoccus sp. AF10-3]
MITQGKTKVYIVHAKSPGVPAPGLFYSIRNRRLKPEAHCQLPLSVQPFANIVSNYTCRNRK